MTVALDVGKRMPGATVTDVLLFARRGAPGESGPERLLRRRGGDSALSSQSGLAVATPAGLTVPVMHNGESLSLVEISQLRKDLVTRARDGGLAMKESSTAPSPCRISGCSGWIVSTPSSTRRR